MEEGQFYLKNDMGLILETISKKSPILSGQLRSAVFDMMKRLKERNFELAKIGSILTNDRDMTQSCVSKPDETRIHDIWIFCLIETDGTERAVDVISQVVIDFDAGGIVVTQDKSIVKH